MALWGTPLGIGRDGEHDFRISIAGAQEKTAFLWNNSWQLPTGSTPTTHIFKSQIGKIANGLDLSQSVENEHFCMTLCRELGLKTAETEILDFEDVRVLSIKRFDRLWTKDGRLLRLPQEDFCQALSTPPTRKYNVEGGPGIVECLHLLSGSDYATQDRYNFMKAQIVFWMMGATDGHAKNFSLFLNSGGRFQMPPLYDIISTQPNLDNNEMQRREFKLAMAVGKRRNYAIFRIGPRHFEQSAHAVEMAIREIQNIREVLRDELKTALERTINAMPDSFPHEIASNIISGMHVRSL